MQGLSLESTLLGYPYVEKRKDCLFYQMFQVKTKTSLRLVNSQEVEVYLVLSLSYTLKKSINEKVLNTLNNFAVLQQKHLPNTGLHIERRTAN